MATAVVEGVKKVTIAGIPNSGKTTIFNGLTGSHQRVGNWPGVTVEKIEGSLPLKDSYAHLIDLPGTYNLSPNTEDQRIAAHAIESDEHDLVINVVDASNLTRNLYLTQDILRRRSNVVILLNMIDVAEQEGLKVDHEALERELGVPVVPVVGVSKKSIESARAAIENALENPTKSASIPKFPETTQGIYDAIDKIYSKVVTEKKDNRKSFTDKFDRIVLNKWAAVPIFLISMYVVFWFAVGVGGAFIDFFDIMGGFLFVDGFAWVLDKIGTPGWLIAFFAGGVGAGLQTVATFVPVIFFIFLALAILQDSGYMARLAVIADRFMRHIGLPGNAFIPMMVGFGCTVPAVMSARTLSTRRDRFMTIFMAPFMSCGARLPVYALFCAALYGKNSALVVFAIYLLGIVMSVLTGLLLRKTLFAGRVSNFVMDLPFYHIPRFKVVMKSSWVSLKAFIIRAGSIITIAVLFLGFFNSMGYSREDGITFGNEDSEQSVLTVAGKSLSPIFKPMGIQEENWPATVALFTGLFAKEVIVGTVNSLYSAMRFAEEARAEAGNEPDNAIAATGAEQEGMSGMSGMQGMEGMSGMSGMQGMEGMSGMSGMQGMEGMSGMSGMQGMEGMSGMSGMQGMEGMSGMSGMQGKQEAAIAAEGQADEVLQEAEAGEEVAEEDEGLDFVGTTVEALASVKDGLLGLFTSADLVGVSQVTEDQDTIAEELETDTAVFYYMQKYFTPVSAFAYMIFVLLYFPCLAVVGAAGKEMGRFYTTVYIVYLTLLGWASATLFYQLFEGHNALYIGISVGILALIYIALKVISSSKTLAFKE